MLKPHSHIDSATITVADGREEKLATELGMQGFMIFNVRARAMEILTKGLDDPKEIRILNSTLLRFGARMNVQLEEEGGFTD